MRQQRRAEVMLCSWNVATWKLDRVADLSSEVLVVKSGRKRQQETDSCINSREDTVVSFRAYWVLYVVLWRSGVRAKPGIIMVGWRELQPTRLINEGRYDREWKRCRQKSLSRAVVGSHPWLVRVQHFVQNNRTPTFFVYLL